MKRWQERPWPCTEGPFAVSLSARWVHIKAEQQGAPAYFHNMCLWPCWAQSLVRSHRWRIKCLCTGDSHTRTSAQRLIPCMMMLSLRTHLAKILLLSRSGPEQTSMEVIMECFRPKLHLHHFTYMLYYHLLYVYLAYSLAFALVDDVWTLTFSFSGECLT